MSEMPKPIPYCLGHILRTCPECSYDTINNPKCPEYRAGNLYSIDIEQTIRDINANATRTGLEEELDI